MTVFAFGVTDFGIYTAAAGSLAAVYQLQHARRELREGFERSFVDRYERISAAIPLDVLVGVATPNLDDPAVERAFFDYFELCEEELYFRAWRKVCRSTWKDWWHGIALNLANPSFVAAWEHLRSKVQASESPHARFERLSIAIPAAIQRTSLHEPERPRLIDRLRR